MRRSLGFSFLPLGAGQNSRLGCGTPKLANNFFLRHWQYVTRLAATLQPRFPFLCCGRDLLGAPPGPSTRPFGCQGQPNRSRPSTCLFCQDAPSMLSNSELGLNQPSAYFIIIAMRRAILIGGFLIFSEICLVFSSGWVFGFWLLLQALYQP